MCGYILLHICEVGASQEYNGKHLHPEHALGFRPHYLCCGYIYYLIDHNLTADIDEHCIHHISGS